MPKTYVPELRDLTNHWLYYADRYAVKLDGALDTPTFEKLLAARQAMFELSVALGPEILVPDAETP